ncbi:hypothetical protein BH18THE1_BH18THE1_16000 [soil metagenome]
MPDARYHKVKHLVEVEDDIFAVFTVSAEKDGRLENLSIAKNANITRDFVDNIFAWLLSVRSIGMDLDMNKIVGHLKWTIHETDGIRALVIYEKDQDVVALIKSNTSLSETVDNILGYYYEE